MKNMNNKKLFAVLAVVTVLFASCNNGLQTKNSEQPEGKARISFRIDDVSRNMKSDNIGWNDIRRIVIKVKKYDTLASGGADSSKSPVQYCNDIFWMTTTDSVTNEISTAYDKLQTYEQEFDFGWYKFDLELYLDTSGTKQCYYGGTMESKIDSSTTQLTFRAIPTGTGTGDLNVKFCWDYYPVLPESADNLPILYMEAGLYSDLACTEAVTGSELEKDLQEDYSDAETFYNNNWNYLDDDQRDPDNAPPYEISWNYEVQSIPIGTYYLKYTLYYTNSVYDEGTGDYISENIKLNSFVEEVKINGLGISETREFEQDDVNKIPVIKGGIIFNSTLIDIECDSDNSGSDFYLNNGTITFRVKDHDTKEFINPNNVSVELYYGSQRVDESYYSFDNSQTGTYGEEDLDRVFEFKLKEDKPLLAGGKYQLSIIATKPASASANTSGPFFYSARTIDLDVKPLSYFEFNAGDYDDAAELGDAIEDNLKGLRSDVEIKICGTPNDLEEIYINSDSIYSARDYYSTISEKLKEMVKYNLVDLDMSQLDCAYEMGESAFNNCECLNSIKLPASLHKIDSEAIKGATNLKTIEFTIDDNYYDIYDISLDASAFFNLTDFVQDYPVTYLSALEKIKVTNNTENETNLYTIDNGKILLCKTGASTASVKMVIPSETQIALPTDGDVSITKIDDFAFAGSEATTITGLSNVTSVGQGAFKESKIKTFDFGSALERVDSRAFKSSKLETLGTNVNGITYIGDHAFERSEITAIPDLSHLADNLGSDAFKSCTNFQTITVDENFVDIINSNRVTYDSFASCSTKNLIINCDFILSYTNGSDSSGGYDLPYTIDGVTNTTSKTSIINMFRVTDTLTFNKKVTLPALTYNTNTPSDSGDNGFFSSSQGSYDRVGLAHLVFNDTSIIGKGQFNKFRYLSSITFNDASNLSEIGDQAFWLGNSMQLYSAEYDDSIGQQKPGTRRPQDIVLNGVRKIGYQAINKVTETGTLTIPESVLAIQNGAFDGVMYGVTIEVEGQDSDNWLLLSKTNAEAQIDTWLTTPESSLPAESTDDEANPKIEKNDITNDDITYSELTWPTSNYSGNKWYYRWTSN